MLGSISVHSECIALEKYLDHRVWSDVSLYAMPVIPLKARIVDTKPRQQAACNRDFSQTPEANPLTLRALQCQRFQPRPPLPLRPRRSCTGNLPLLEGSSVPNRWHPSRCQALYLAEESQVHGSWEPLLV